MKFFSHSYLILTVFAFLLPCSTQGAVAGQLKQRGSLTGVTPEPQEVNELKSESPFIFSDATVILMRNPDDRIGAELLQDDLRKRFGLEVPIVKEMTGRKVSSLVVLERFDDRSVDNSDLKKLGETQKEGYRMVVKNGGCVIQGHDARGTLYGVQTLRQLIFSDATVEPVAIRDWPEMPWRVSYCGLFRDQEKILAHVRRCARLKINTVILESYWNGPQNWWYNPAESHQRLARQFFDECRKYHIEPVPLVQGFGWGYGVTDLEPMAAEGVWGEDEPVMLHYDKGTDLKRPNVVTTPDTAPIVVTGKSGEPYKPGVDFEIIPGLTRRPYQEDNKPWQLRALPGGRIADGQTVLVDYNAVTPGPHKSYCPAEPRTYELVDRTIDHVMKTHKPDVIHIGHDELFNSMTDSRCLNSGMTKAELVLRDVLHWYDRIKMHNPDVKIMMWYDFLRLDHKRTGSLVEVAEQLPKDIIICPWMYRKEEIFRANIPRHIALEEKLGFQIIGTAAGYWPRNNLDWYDALSKRLTSEGGSVLGMMFSYWGDNALVQSCLPVSAELMWSGHKMDRELFTRIESATIYLKKLGLGLTFDLGAQRKTLADWFNKELLSGSTPTRIAGDFHEHVLNDELLYTNLYGRQRWHQLQSSPFAEQHAGMMQKLPLFVEAMAAYAQAEHELSQGGKDHVQERIQTIANNMARIGVFDKSRATRLKEEYKDTLPASEELFGFKLEPYRPDGEM